MNTSFCVKILRLVSPTRERERREVRAAVAQVSAHAEDLAFTTKKLCNGGLQTSSGLRSLSVLPE